MPAKKLRNQDRIPPQDPDAEMALLGSMMMFGNGEGVDWSFDDVRATVGTPEAFYCDQRHADIYRALLDTHDAGEPIDMVVMSDRLAKLDNPSVKDEYLVHLAESFADWANALCYARGVRRAHQLRCIIRAANRAAEAAYEHEADPADIIAHLSKRLEAIDDASASDREAIHEAEMLRTMQNPADAVSNIVPVTLGDLGRRLSGGLERGTLTVVGARPACGKTSLGVTLALHCSGATDGCPVAFLSGEMTCDQLDDRFLAARSGRSVEAIRTGEVEDFETVRDQAAHQAESEHGIYILDGVLDVRALIAHAKRLIRRHSVGLVIIDYLQRLNMPGRFERHELLIGEMTKAFKTLALETRVAVVLLAQLNRQAEDGREPRLSDLRDSGRIEQEADNVLLLSKPANVPDDQEQVETDIIIAKQRQGTTGRARLIYHRPTMTFRAMYRGGQARLALHDGHGAASSTEWATQ